MSHIDFCISHEIFVKLQAGDEQAFELIYNKFYGPLFKKVNSLCKNEDISNEIIQETFTQFFLNKSKIKEAEGVYAYLYTVSRRFAISSFRKSVVQANYQSYISKTFIEADSETFQSIIEKDLYKNLHHLIDELPEQQGKVFKMNKLEEMSYKEIANSIGTSAHTVRNQIASATKIIRLRMSKLLILLFFILFF